MEAKTDEHLSQKDNHLYTTFRFRCLEIQDGSN